MFPVLITLAKAKYSGVSFSKETHFFFLYAKYELRDFDYCKKGRDFEVFFIIVIFALCFFWGCLFFRGKGKREIKHKNRPHL